MQKLENLACYYYFFSQSLFKDSLCKDSEILTPVHPDMSAIVLVILIRELLLVQVCAIVLVYVVEEVRVSDAYPVELRLCCLQRVYLAGKLLVGT